MENLIRITEEDALREGTPIQEMVITYFYQGYIVYSDSSHPAVGRVITLVTPQFFAKKLVNALDTRDKMLKHYEDSLKGGNNSSSYSMQA